MQLVLVTGAAGAIGNRLLAMLHDHAWRTRALVHTRPVEGADENVEGDLRLPSTLMHACDGVDAVIHLAALTHSRHDRAYFEINTEGTRALLHAAPADLSRFVHVSTRAISKEGGSYSRSKLESEEAVRSSGLPSVIVRLPEVFGGGSREGVDDILTRARHGRAILVVGKGNDPLCPAHVDDVIPILVTALTAPVAVGKTYTLAGECLPIRQLALRAKRVFGSRSRIVSVPVPAVRALAAAARYLPLPLYPDQLARLKAPKPGLTLEAERDLGFRPRPLDQALEDAAA